MSQWFYHTGDEQRGPYSPAELREEVRAGRLREAHHVWREGMEEWAPANRLKGLFAHQASAPPTPPPRPHTASYRPNAVAEKQRVATRDLSNPFSAPQHFEEPFEDRPTRRKYARWLTRGGALILDGIICFFLNLAAGFTIGIALGILIALSGGNMNDSDEAFGAIGMLVGLITQWLYYALMTSSSHMATWGKQAGGIIVTDLKGRRISFGRATARYLCAVFVPLFTLGIDYLLPFFTEHKQCLHDIIAGTIVVEAKRR